MIKWERGDASEAQAVAEHYRYLLDRVFNEIDEYAEGEEVGYYCTGCASLQVNRADQNDEHEPGCIWVEIIKEHEERQK